MLYLRSLMQQGTRQAIQQTKARGISSSMRPLHTQTARPKPSILSQVQPFNRDQFSSKILPLVAGRHPNFSTTAAQAKEQLPIVDLNDFASHDQAKRKAFIENLGNSLKDYGFVAVAGHDITPKLMDEYYATIKDVFALPMDAKKQYVRPQMGRNRGYYELGQETKNDKASGGKKMADLKENWHTGAVANVFPEEAHGKVPEFKRTAMSLYAAMEKTSTKLVDAIGQFMDSVGLKDKGYLKSTMQGHNEKPIGSHLLRSIHYPPVQPEQIARFKPGEPVIRAGEHDDLNLITLLPESVEPGLEILRRKNGVNDHWMPVHSQEGHLICNSGKMLSLISGGKINDKGDIIEQGLLPSIRHRVVGDTGSLNKARYSTPFFVTPHYDKPLRNLKTGEELSTGEFLYRRLKGHGSLDSKTSYAEFRQNADPMLIKEELPPPKPMNWLTLTPMP